VSALEEIKEESIGRAERGGYPLIGLDPADVREAFQSIATLDRDEWAAAWMALGDRYYTKAQSAAAAGNSDEAWANYLRAWRLYSFGRWRSLRSRCCWHCIAQGEARFLGPRSSALLRALRSPVLLIAR
jgi:hypothetical protein